MEHKELIGFLRARETQKAAEVIGRHIDKQAEAVLETIRANKNQEKQNKEE